MNKTTFSNKKFKPLNKKKLERIIEIFEKEERERMEDFFKRATFGISKIDTNIFIIKDMSV